MNKNVLLGIGVALLIIILIAWSLRSDESSNDDIQETNSTTTLPGAVQGAATTTASSTRERLTGSAWSWEGATASSGQAITPRQDNVFTLTFSENDRVSGTTDCNNFSGNYVLNGNELTFSALAQTKKACENSQEVEFVELLTSAPLIVNLAPTGELKLRRLNNPALLRFSPMGK